ncbi:hypothetical protein [Paracraurococcus lichenis]|uniref:Uncharacterized protein n=1 Tax=Paracraurococcus lichenis TaxID=3064888 RepID=A0ABT9EA77_9PROT|nr:hypothetical protein [Paracraurococcus sp. LOR1-02]MDO9713109.1 hypothetical protein [Paracraurococcus sp. LOR1-02]
MSLVSSRRADTPPHLGDPALLAALALASAAVARLDAATALHPLLPALLHRTRLDAARRQAAADGHLIDPWHLAAALEGLPLRAMRDSERIMDAGAIQDAARLTLDYHGWLSVPDEDAEAAVRAALAALEGQRPYGVPLLDAAWGAWLWLERGGTRPPLRAALVRRWLAARAAVAAGRRSTSRAPAAVDLLAAVPLVSATTLAAALGMSVKAACAILDELVRLEVAVEVTHRHSRRLFGLAGLAPLRQAAAPPRRPLPGRGRGRPREVPAAVEVPPEVVTPAPPLRAGPLERRAFDYGDLEAAMQAVDAAIRKTRAGLARLAGSGQANADGAGGGDSACPTDSSPR